ncbi:MAG TPA: hypothetical protein VFN55_01860, partial [Solirubrobacteraceae bacterium]|nr:hypothetical protein [Solirubrobacteraceae bacterium]
MRRLLLLTLAGLGALGALGAGSVAASASAPPPPPVWNNGYGWWPPGFGYPPLTVRVPGYTCTVTAAGPTFHSYPREWRQDFGGSVRCPSTLGTRS